MLQVSESRNIKMLDAYKNILECVVIQRKLYRDPTKRPSLNVLADVRMECCRYSPYIPYPSTEIIVRDLCRTAKRLAPVLLAEENVRRKQYRKWLARSAKESPQKRGARALRMRRKGMTLKEIGKALDGVSAMRASQIIKKAQSLVDKKRTATQTRTRVREMVS